MERKVTPPPPSQRQLGYWQLAEEVAVLLIPDELIFYSNCAPKSKQIAYIHLWNSCLYLGSVHCVQVADFGLGF